MSVAGAEDVLPLVGLFDDPNPFTVPKGGLAEAENVVFRRKGVAEPRAGLVVSRLTGNKKYPVKLAPFNDDVVIFRQDQGDSTWSMQLESDGTVIDSSLTFDDTRGAFALLQDALFFCADSGPQRLEPDMSTIVDVGIPQPSYASVFSTTTGANPFTSGEVYAYRICVVRERPNGRLVRSATSSRAVFEATSDGAAFVRISSQGLEEGDLIEIYRTFSAADRESVGDTMYLATTHTVTSANVAATTFDVLDETLEEDLGELLYSNPQGETDVFLNYRPPVSKEIARFGDVALYANVVEEYRARFSLNSLYGRDGIAYYEATGDFTSSNALVTNVTITGPSAVAGTATSLLRVGMFVTDGADPETAGTNIPALTQISVVNPSGAGTLTMSNGALNNNTTATFYIGDRVIIGADVFYAWGSNDATNRLFEVSSTGVYQTGVNLLLSMIQNITGYSIQFLTGQEDIEFVETFQLPTNIGLHPDFGLSSTSERLINTIPTFELTQIDRSSFSALTISSSAPEAFTPDLSWYSISETDFSKPNRLYWSKYGEHEHVPGVNYQDVGPEQAEILRLVATKDVLFVFTSQGLYGLTGASPDQFRLDPLDVSLVLSHVDLVDTTGTEVAAVTNKGLVLVSPEGQSDLSGTPIGDRFDVLRDAVEDTPRALGYGLVVDPKNQEILVCFDGTVLRCNYGTLAWSEVTCFTDSADLDARTSDWCSLVFDRVWGQGLRVGRYSTDYTGNATGRVSREGTDAWDNSGSLSTYTLSHSDAFTDDAHGVDANGDAWFMFPKNSRIPKVGDRVRDDSGGFDAHVLKIEDVTSGDFSGTHVKVYYYRTDGLGEFDWAGVDVGSTIDYTPILTMYESVVGSLEVVAIDAGAPQVSKNWIRVEWLADLPTDAYLAFCNLRTDNQQDGRQFYLFPAALSRTSTLPLRFDNGRQQAFGRVLRARLQMYSTGAWQLLGLRPEFSSPTAATVRGNSGTILAR